MADKDIQSIQVYVAGRAYPLKVNAEDVDFIKGIAEEVNEKITHFQRTYSNRDKQDCLCMALLTYAVDLHRHLKANDNSEITDKIQKLDQLIDTLLQ